MNLGDYNKIRARDRTFLEAFLVIQVVSTYSTRFKPRRLEMKYIVTVRGMLKGTPEQAKLVHNEIVAKTAALSKSMGNVAHHPHLNVQNGKEFFSIDRWDNLENIQKLYSDPNLAAEFGKLFEGMPDIAIWAESGWLEY